MRMMMPMLDSQPACQVSYIGYKAVYTSQSIKKMFIFHFFGGNYKMGKKPNGKKKKKKKLGGS